METQSINLPLSWENETSEQSCICHAERDPLKKQTILFKIYISYMWYGQYSKARLSGELFEKVN